MIILTIEAENGEQKSIKVPANELVAEVKALCHGLFTGTAGKLITLRYGERELEDERCLGDYNIRGKGNLVEMVVPQSQPYSQLDYSKLAASYVKEGKKRSLSDFFAPGRPADEWDGKWEKGDEYLSYPPVDVNNIWSSIEPAQSRELIGPASPRQTGSRPPSRNPPSPPPRRSRNGQQSQTREAADNNRRNGTRRSSDNYEPTTSTRNFHSLYCCNVNGFNFSVLHKLEGNWSGVAHFLGEKLQTSEKHACSSKLRFDNEKSCWSDQQLFTSRDGLCTGRVFKYIPHAHGSLFAENDDPDLMTETTMTLKELSSNILVLSAINNSTGQVIVTETITCSADFHSRVRVVQRFDSFGVLYGVFICKERKVIDAETGALTPLHL